MCLHEHKGFNVLILGCNLHSLNSTVILFPLSVEWLIDAALSCTGGFPKNDLRYMYKATERGVRHNTTNLCFDEYEAFYEWSLGESPRLGRHKLSNTNSQTLLIGDALFSSKSFYFIAELTS